MSDSTIAYLRVDEWPAPKPLPLVWNLLYIPVLLLCAVLVLHLYPSMPDQIPMQVNLSGDVTRTVQKSLASALFPVWIGMFLAVCFTLSHWSMNKQKVPVDSAKSATSAYAFAAYRRAMCLMLLATGILLCLCLGTVLPLASAGILTIVQGIIIISIVLVAIVVCCIVFALVYGQNGSRLCKDAQASGTMSRDDDRCWKAGAFYVNAKDPSLFVPKRFGVGTTPNFGNKTAWVVVVGFVIVLALFVAFICGM